MITDRANLDTMDPDSAAGSGQGVFAFEADFARDLRCIPMVVRFKLDRICIKLSLKQWTKIGHANRRALAELACDTPHETAGYRLALLRMIAQHTLEPVVALPAETDPAWADPSRVPAQVIAQAAAAGISPPTASQWARLPTLKRFALLKLARSNHDNHNFEPAMQEFGLGG